MKFAYKIIFPITTAGLLFSIGTSAQAGFQTPDALINSSEYLKYILKNGTSTVDVNKIISSMLQDAAAQKPPPGKVVLAANPESPSVGEKIEVTASLGLTDKDKAIFSWSVNGVLQKDRSGKGKSSIELTAGPIGSSVKVSVSISGIPEQVSPAFLNIFVSNLALTWYSDTYVPKWYRGKALPSPNSNVTFVAIPSMIVGGKSVPADNVLYSWKLGYNDPVTGVGLQTYTIPMGDLPAGTSAVEVTAVDPQGQIHKIAQAFVEARAREVVIYPSSPLGGTEYRSAANLFKTTKKGMYDFAAEPFFFPVPSRDLLTFEWSIGSKKPEGSPKNPFLLTVDANVAAASAFPLTVRVFYDKEKYFSSTEKTISFLSP